MNEKPIRIKKKTLPRAPGQRGAAFLERPKKAVTIHLDQDVLEFFERDEPGYQVRINDLLLKYAQANGFPQKNCFGEDREV